MEWKDIVPALGILISSILAILGWLFIRYKDREHEKFKARITRREELLKCFLDVHQMIFETGGKVDDRKQIFTHEWIRLCSLMQLYGTKEEYSALKNFANNFFGENRTVEKASDALNDLKNKMIISVKKELGFNNP